MSWLFPTIARHTIQKGPVPILRRSVLELCPGNMFFEVLVNKFVVSGIFFVIFVAGLGVIIAGESVSFDEILRALSDLNPRLLSLIALPFIAVLFVLGVYLRKKSEERKWKNALLKTRAKKGSNNTWR